MEHRVKIMDPEVLLEEYRTLLQTVDQLPLVISGNSMSPFLIHGRDTVFLTKITRPLRRGDIVLFRRENGAYILHRICAVKGDTFDITGDAQTVIEHGVAREQIFAVVCAVVRKGKRLEPGCFWWDFFERIWLRVIPARHILMRAYAGFSKLLHR